MDDPLDMNIAGRVMLLLSQQGIKDARRLEIFKCAVGAAVRHRTLHQPGANCGTVEPFLDEQLTLLGAALRQRAAMAATAVEPAPLASEAQAADAPPQPRHRARASSGHVPVVKSMEEKLKDERKPVQKLLLEDCVSAGLINLTRAKELIAGMTGKTSQNAETDIVEILRQVLQDQVKGFIRKSKGGPWSNPRAQEDLRQDIHAARSVRGVLTLRRQILKEHQLWEKEHGHGGILGLFSPRRRATRR